MRAEAAGQQAQAAAPAAEIAEGVGEAALEPAGGAGRDAAEDGRAVGIARHAAQGGGDAVDLPQGHEVGGVAAADEHDVGLGQAAHRLGGALPQGEHHRPHAQARVGHEEAVDVGGVVGRGRRGEADERGACVREVDDVPVQARRGAVARHGEAAAAHGHDVSAHGPILSCPSLGLEP